MTHHASPLGAFRGAVSRAISRADARDRRSPRVIQRKRLVMSDEALVRVAQFNARHGIDRREPSHAGLQLWRPGRVSKKKVTLPTIILPYAE